VSITTWNRLECDVVFDDPARGVSRGLGAELFDPLWLLARQIQMAEFHAEDGGSLIHATVTSAAHPIGEITIAGQTMPFDRLMPLEGVVEREPMAIDLRLRIRAGLMLTELLIERHLERLVPLSIGRYGFSRAAEGADSDGQAVVALGAEQAPDAERVRQAIESGDLATDLGVESGETNRFDAAVAAWVAWYRARAGLDSAGAPAADSWIADRLEHRFSLTVPTPAGTMALEAPEYPGGRLDWDAFTVVDVGNPGGTPQVRTVETLPLPLEIPGMPVVRYWEIEDPRFDVARVSIGPGDAARLLLV
jgi:hypothetical protein